MADRLAADLIVMGAVAHSGVTGRFIGKALRTFLERSDRSVLAVSPGGQAGTVLYIGHTRRESIR